MGLDDDLPPGVYGVQLTVEADDIGGRTVPFELALEALEPDARPGRVREPGPEPEPAGAAPAATPTPTPTPTADPPAAGEEDGSSAPVLAGVGIGGLLAGLVGGLAMRRRRTS